MQMFFTGSEESFIYAKSTENQRIESFWSRLKKYNRTSRSFFFKFMINTNLHKLSSANYRGVLFLSLSL